MFRRQLRWLKEMQKYQRSIVWSEKDKIFIAEAKELPGCMAHGRTRKEAFKNLNVAVALWIETAKEFKETIPHPG
jgi:predicted RNase H-like HicB family nuclease